MKILFMGNKNRAVVCLEALLDIGEEIVGVVTPQDSKIESWYQSLKDFASKKKISVFQPVNVNDPKFVQKIQEMDLDLIVMVGYNQILKKDIINIPKKGVLNLHGGKLPEYRGSSTLNWMIINGEVEGGVAIISIDEDIDTGDIVLQERFEIKLEETIKDVIDKTDKIFPGMLVEVIDRIKKNRVQFSSQCMTEGAYYHSRRPRDGEILWKGYSAEQIYNLIRALTHPCPGAFTFFEEKKLIIWKASLLEENYYGVPGRICRRRPEGVVVIAADRGLLIETVQSDNSNECNTNEFFSKLGVDLGK